MVLYDGFYFHPFYLCNMSDFKEFFEALEQSLRDDEFVKLTLSKPLRKQDGLLNVYVRSLSKTTETSFELKYRYVDTTSFKKFSLREIKLVLEELLLKTFRAGTLFTLSYDLLVGVSKKKQVSVRDTPPSFTNKLPDYTQTNN